MPAARICKVCRVTFENPDQHFYRRTPGGPFRGACKACIIRRETSRQAADPCFKDKRSVWTQNGKATRKVYLAKYNQENGELIRQRDRQRRQANLELYRARERERYRGNPNEQKRAKRVAREWYEANKERAKEQRRIWREANRDKKNTYERKRAARKFGGGGSHTAADVLRQLRLQRGRCYWCGCRMGKVWQVDHVIPLAKGGSNGRENIVIACPTCNVKKGSKMPEEFAGRLL